MKTAAVHDGHGTLIGFRMVTDRHPFDPSLSTRPGETERCVCGLPKDHPFHRYTMRAAA